MRVLHSNFIDGEMGLERPDDLPKVIQLINRVPRDERSCYTQSPALFLSLAKMYNTCPILADREYKDQ